MLMRRAPFTYRVIARYQLTAFLKYVAVVVKTVLSARQFSNVARTVVSPRSSQ